MRLSRPWCATFVSPLRRRRALSKRRAEVARALFLPPESGWLRGMWRVQDDIGRRTGTVLTVRGRYYPPGVPRDERDPPLLLHIAPGACHLEARRPAARIHFSKNEFFSCAACRATAIACRCT